MATTENKKPAQTFRTGTVKAAAWENTGRDGVFYTATFSRSFKDADGQWKHSTSFGGVDLEALQHVAFQARLFIENSKS